MINYSDNPLSKIKEISPNFYKLYNISVFVSYIGFIIINWYFINLAYTINIPSYDILCLGCNSFSHIMNVSLILLWLFFLYFYIMQELRFRFAHYSGKPCNNCIKRNNVFYILGSFILMFATLFVII